MAEHVVHIQPAGDIRSRNALDRATAILDRVGERSRDPRAARAAFDMLVAGKERYRIARVTRHVCRHDEEIMDCSSAVVEG